MALAAGTRLGAYEILGALGAGGMGEVYRARDITLGRDVALKTLPDTVVHDSERLARFRREAQVLAALNHPHIAQIHGLEQAERVQFLVLELVDGETLDKRIAPGPIPVEEALAIARQIADALEAAHEKGIIHRDLKPANIALTAAGQVKVLDFGLAKAIEPADGAPIGVTNSPTITTPAMMTGVGVLLGTAAYMSPEQAKGRTADRRSDIWAFGCVVFEMLTGRRAFTGDDVSETLASILKEEPDWSALPPSARPLTSVLRRCLEKDARQRLRDIRDVQLLLDDASRASPVLVAPTIASRWVWWLAAATAVGLIAGGVVTGLVLRSREPIVRGRVERFELISAAHPLTTDPAGANVAISPDGSRIVYTSRGPDARLVLREIDDVETKVIVAGASAWDPFFSPDGQQIGFATLEELRRIPADGGASVPICRLSGVVFSGAAWGPNNAIVFTQGGGLGLFRVSAAGGQPEKLAAPDTTKGEQSYLRPTLLPDGDSVLYTVIGRGSPKIVARSLRTGETTLVLEGGFGARYVPPGYLVYAQDLRLMAAAFDPSTLRVTGSPAVVQENVAIKIPAYAANFAAANDGTTLYVSGRNPDASQHVIWVDRQGHRMASIVEQPLQVPRYLRLSPDGRRIALTVGPPNAGNIWNYDLTGKTPPLKLTYRDHNLFPIWSPDGQRILFISRAGSNRLLWIPANNSSVEPDLLLTTEEPEVPQDWSRDGHVLLSKSSGLALTDLLLLQISDRTTRPWLATPFAESEARFSHDGHWVAYTSDQTGRSEVWVRPFPGPGAPVRVSPDGGNNPVWSRDDHELFYRSAAKMLSAPVASTAPDLRVETPRVLFEGGFESGSQRFYDVAPDGRFRMIEAPASTPSASVVVVRNWAEALKARVPAARPQ